jgi:hypothetical protein
VHRLPVPALSSVKWLITFGIRPFCPVPADVARTIPTPVDARANESACSRAVCRERRRESVGGKDGDLDVVGATRVFLEGRAVVGGGVGGLMAKSDKLYYKNREDETRTLS